MRRVAAIVSLMFAAVLVCPQTASAQGGKGYIEKMSGPGPFDGIETLWRLGCLPKPGAPSADKTFVSIIEQQPPFGERLLCVDFGYSEYENKTGDRRRRGPVDLTVIEGHVTYLFLPSKIVDIGFSVGAMKFVGDFRGDAFSFWRPTIAPVRATLRPLKAIQAIAKTEQQGARDWLAIVKVTWSPRWIAGRLTGADFRDPTSTLDESWEYVAGGAYVLVDFSEIIWP